MIKSKLIAASLSLAGAMLFASASYGQAPQIVAVGSSGAFTSAVIAMVNGDPITGGGAYCGTNVWTGGSSIATAVDNRGGVPTEGGNIAVVWDNSASPTTVCAYLSVDSVVGQRLFLGQSATGNATLSLTVAAQTTAGGNKVSFIQDNAVGLPLAVYNLVNGAHFNIAFTDIRPEDGQFAYQRASCSLIPGDTAKQCMGYGPSPIGTKIQSAYDSSTVQPVAYAISGSDPITGIAIPAFKTLSLGASPVMVIVNTTDVAPGGLGTAAIANINSHTLGAIFTGFLGGSGDINPSIGGPGKLLHVAIREPLSGTYNTFEWQAVRDRDGKNDNSQELNVDPTPAGCYVQPSPATYFPPATTCGNPMNAPGPYGSPRTRVIGTGQMVSAINSANNPDSIGYAFYGLGTFGGKANVKYLTVDGVDPLYPTYAGGSFPNCTGFFNAAPAFSCIGTLPNYAGVTSGNYRIWSVLRAVVYSSYVPPASGPSATGLITVAQDQAHVNVPDFVPFQYCGNATCSSFVSGLPVFRSHYSVSGVAIAHNGNIAALPEAGGDMGGAIFNLQSDRDYFNTSGNELVTYVQ
ncbi:MAG: hypothetical protein PVS2B2_25100 [Candidatus Acidiferrum sp.]